MSAVWTDENKFSKWLDVELAVLRVRERRGEIPTGTAEGIAKATYVDPETVSAINHREEVTKHDLNAFLDVMRLQIIPPTSSALLPLAEILAKGHPEKWDSYFHEGMTSYDTEEPAMALLLREANLIILEGIDRVKKTLFARANKYRRTLMIGRTHGQWAQPVTFGKRCLDWHDMVQRAEERFMSSAEEVDVMKLSGAVGFYGVLGPDIEAAVAEELELDVVKIATQIVPLDRRADHIVSLALLAAAIEKIARDLWLLSQSEVREVREPFGEKQKGSSAMPHKKNPITLEKLFGLPRLVRAYSHVMCENIATAHERDIGHSSVERIAVPDAFGLTDHMLRQLGRVLEGMEVFPDRMAENIAASYETYATQELATLLTKKGVAAETAYRFLQTCSFQAMTRRIRLSEVFRNADNLDVSYDLRREVAESPEFDKVLDPSWWVRHEDDYYRRFGL